MVHFSTHGVYNRNRTTAWQIKLSGTDTLEAIEIEDTWVQIKSARSFIVMSSCQSARRGFFLFDVGGWADKFLEMGPPVFIGTMWRVNDEVAFNFTQHLYSILSNSKAMSIAESVREAREACREEFASVGDYSWLAYQLYAQPNFEVKFAKYT